MASISQFIKFHLTSQYERIDPYVIISCVADDDEYNLTHYMVFTDGQDSIFMGTYTVTQPSLGELRYIFRLAELLGSYPSSIYGDVANTAGGTTIEGADVIRTDEGETHSKFYSSERFIDDDVYCATDSDAVVHACFLRPDSKATEKSSGGPFFRDINFNPGSTYNALTYYMNSGHVQTEEYRTGFHGPYVFAFSKDGPSSASSFDTSFFDDLDLTGYTGESGRGYVSGTASGVSTDFPTVIHWYNDDAQAWTYASETGSFTSPPLLPGTYTMKLYQDEFLAATTNVSVTAQATTTEDIAATSTVLTSDRTTIFQLGDYDGQPTGFRNAEMQLRMHPSDDRMSDWNPGPINSTDTEGFPMAIFMDVNNDQKITVDLDSAISETATLRIATTLSFAGGRPQAFVNDYECPVPGAPSTIDSRGVTRGAYRGWGTIYECEIPSGNLESGENIISIEIVSGSTGETYLSPNIVSTLPFPISVLSCSLGRY